MPQPPSVGTSVSDRCWTTASGRRILTIESILRSLLGVRRWLGTGEGDASTDSRNDGTEADYSFATQAECPLCRQGISVSKLLPLQNL